MDKLDEIMAWKRQDLARRGRPVGAHELARWERPARRGCFSDALRRAEGLAVIAEIKRRSPSAGSITELADVRPQAEKYLQAGADALSILTDEPFFGGSLEDLRRVAEWPEGPARAPLLRKDFLVHPLQVLEAAEAQADCILIIVRCLAEDEMKVLRDAARTAGLDCLWEIHQPQELDTALRLGAEMIGVNNRDLGRFVTDLRISEKLIPLLPANCLAVAESGIWTVEDARRMKACGARAVLVGEALMRTADPGALIRSFRAVDC